MFDTCEQTAEFALIEAIAAALREELGVAIEEQPGFHDPSEAGQVNRAFRVDGPDHPPDHRAGGERPAGDPERRPRPARPAAARGGPARRPRGRSPARPGARRAATTGSRT